MKRTSSPIHAASFCTWIGILGISLTILFGIAHWAVLKFTHPWYRTSSSITINR